jgi:subtilisin-like proprotein convertase family protein
MKKLCASVSTVLTCISGIEYIGKQKRHFMRAILTGKNKKSILLTTLLLILMLVFTNLGKAQSITNYTFAASSGTFTALTGAISPTLVGSYDDGYFNTLPIGFTFYYMGTSYSAVSSSTNGWMTFGQTISNAAYTNVLSSDGTRPLIAPLWDDLDLTGGTFSYLSSGTAPNRIFTAQWLNMQWNYLATGQQISFQVKLYEGSGKIEFIYRQETGTLNNASASIGITATAPGSGNFLSLNGTGTSPSASSTTETSTLNTMPASGQIYSFTPPPSPVAPTNLTFTSVTFTGMTLNWTAASPLTNVRNYEIYISTDNSTFNYVNAVSVGTNTYAATGLTAGTVYYWKVYSVSEGARSSALTGTQAISASITSNSTTAITWVAPCGVTSVTVECYGSGGGGGSSANTNAAGGSGGGGGAYSMSTLAVIPGNTYYLKVGEIGTGGPANSNTAPGAGGDTWFNSSNNAPTSMAGVLARGGRAGVNNSTSNPANGGTVSGGYGTIKNPGNSGAAGANNGGGNGGAGALPHGGAGGTSSNNNDGGAGTAPGGGGGGSDDAARRKGGDGALGQVIIQYMPVAMPANVMVEGGGSVCESATLIADNGGSGTIYFQGTTSGGTSTGIPSTSQVVTASGTYYFRAQSAAGCWGAEGSAIVTIAVPPVVTITPSSATVCNGSVQQLTATNYVNSSPQMANSGTISLIIPDNNAIGATSTLPVSGIPADATITDISVDFNTIMPYDGDLIFNIKAPNGNILNLVNQKGGSGDDFTNTIISSSSTIPVNSGLAPFSGTYAADAAISVGPTSYVSNVTSFSGLYSVPNGDWIFAVRDAAGQDIGTVTSWSITITYTRPVVTWSPTTGLYTDAGAITSYSGGPATTVYAKPASSQTYTATVTTGNGCTNSGSVSLAVTLTVGTPGTPTPSASTICQGSGYTIYTTSATNATSFTWSVTGSGNTISGTGTTGTVTWAPGFSGIATVSVIANGCGTSSPSSTTVTVTASVTPGVTISASANPVGSGIPVTFTPTPVNGGTPTYDWRVNGFPVGTGNTYSYTPNDLDQVYVIMTSTLSCVTTAGATSNIITMMVNPLITSVSWTGLVDSDWNTPGNWAPAMVPGPGNSVTILNVANKPVISTSGNECNNLTLSSGANLTIAYNGNLTVNGDLDNNAGSSTDLVIQSTSSGTGSLITKGAVTGTATVERYMGGVSWSWHFLSSPVTAQQVTGGFTPTVSGYDFYTWYEPQLTWVNVKNTTTAPTWNTANGNTNFLPGRGYLVAYEATNTIKDFAGMLNSGSINYSLTNSGTTTFQYFNLVGNPFPCSIDWEASSGWDRSNLNGTQKSFWVWNDAAGNYGAYITGSYGFGTNGVTNYIPSGQGYMVLAETAGSFTLDDRVKTHSVQNYLKSEKIINEEIRLKLSCDANAYSDEAIIAFNNNPEEGSLKFNSMFANAPELWSVKNGTNYSINFIVPNSDIAVPLTVKAGVAGNYTLTASQAESFGNNSSVSLEDRASGSYTYFNTTPSFTFEVNEPGIISERFFLHFMDVTGIPNSEVAVDFKIYASDGMLNIQSMQQLSGKIAIIDMLGRTVATGRIEAGATIQVNMRGNTGVYIVSVLTGKGIRTTKILVK